MNLKNLFRLLVLLLGFLVITSEVAFAQGLSTVYCNSTNGDDGYTGRDATNSVPGQGPKQTIEGAIKAAASGATIYIAAGTYNTNGSTSVTDANGVDGGNDANGVQITTANLDAGSAVTGVKNITFVVQTFQSFTSVVIPAGIEMGFAGRTVAWQPTTAGTEGLTIQASLKLTDGTIDVTALGTKCSVSSGTAIIRTDGAFLGTPAYSGNYDVTYNGTKSITAGSELPSNIGTGTLTFNQASATITINSPLGVKQGRILNSNQGKAVFTGKVTMQPTGAIIGIQSTVAGSLTFGDVEVDAKADLTASNYIEASAGKIEITGNLSLVNSSSSSAPADALLSIENSGASSTITIGYLTETPVAYSGTTYDFYTDIVNSAAGTLNLGSSAGTSTVNGVLGTSGLKNETSGKLNIKGDVNVNGEFWNGWDGATPNTNAATNIAGNNLNLLGDASTNYYNYGAMSSTSVGTGFLNFAAGSSGFTYTIIGNGNLPNISNSSKHTVVLSGTGTVSGNVGNSSSGQITFSNAYSVAGNISVAGGTVLGTGALTISGDVSISGGTFDLGAGSVTHIVNGDVKMTGGGLTFNSSTLNLKGDLVRTSGTVSPGSGTLEFSSTGGQNFNGGANFATNNFVVSGIGTTVTMASSIVVDGNATINANTTLVLGTYNLRMQGTNATFTLSGAYSSSGGGGIIFEATSGNQNIAGTGIYSNIEVRLATSADRVLAPASTITWSGILTFTRGGITIPASGYFNPSTTYTTPSIRRNLAGAPTPDGIGFDGAGTFNQTGVSYNLDYFGTLTANRAVGAEFVTGATPRVVNLGISTAGAFSVTLGNAVYRFTGGLTVAAGSNLDITGTSAGDDLIAQGSNVTHTIYGTIATSSLGIFKVTGSDVKVVGSTGAATDGYTATLGNTEFAGGNVDTVSNIKTFSGALTLSSGTLQFGLAKLKAEANTQKVQGTFTEDGGTLMLASDVTFEGTVTQNSGIFNLDDYNAYITGGPYTLGSQATVSHADSTDNGYVVLDGTFNVDANGRTIPRLKLTDDVNPASTVTLLSDLTVSEILDQSMANTSVVLAMGANDLEISAPEWNVDAGVAGAYTGTGTINLTGRTALTAYADFSVPNIYVESDDTITVKTDDMDTPSPRTVSATTFELKKGTVDLQINDLEVTGAASAFAYTAGSFMSDGGEVVFNNAGLTTSLAADVSIPYLNVKANAAISNEKNIEVTKRITVGNATLSSSGSNIGALKMADDSWIVKSDPTPAQIFDEVPTFEGMINVKYAGTGAFATGRELPTDVAVLSDLTMDVVGSLTFTTASSKTPVQVNGTLTLAEGTLKYDSKRPLDIADKATVVVGFSGATAGKIDQVSTQAAVNPLGGYYLTYTATAGDITTTSKEWPSDATILGLIVKTGKGGSSPADHMVSLHADRTVKSLDVDALTSGSSLRLGSTTKSYTLTVDGDVTVNKGYISSSDNTTPSVGTLVCKGNVDISGGAIGTTTSTAPVATGANLTFAGDKHQNFTLGSAQTINALTLDQTTSALYKVAHVLPKVRLSGNNLTLTGMLTFKNGLLVVADGKYVKLNQVAGASAYQGFDHSQVVSPNVSHIVGNARLSIKQGTSKITGRNEFPVGDSVNYRPVAITIVGSGNNTVGADVTINEVNMRPTGIVGLPIVNGVNDSTDVARYPNFYWNISSTASLGNQKFDLELTSQNFTDYDNITNVRILRRIGTEADTTNPWSLQGVEYDNYTSGGVPSVDNVNSQGGISQASAIFTYGMATRLDVNPIADKTIGKPLNPLKISLAGVFSGSVGDLTYSASSTNTTIATVAIVGDTLIVTPVTDGQSDITVKATDVNGDFSTTTFKVTVNSIVDVAQEDQLPTQFELYQNYPNPFNPTTKIKFALPKESNVKLTVYNVLGQEVATLVNNTAMNAGYHTVNFDASRLATGLYIYRIQAKDFVSVKKMMLIK